MLALDLRFSGFCLLNVGIIGTSPPKEKFFGRLCAYSGGRGRQVSLSPGLPDLCTEFYQCYLWCPISKNKPIKPLCLFLAQLKFSLIKNPWRDSVILHKHNQFFWSMRQAILHPFCSVYSLMTHPLNTSKLKPERPHERPPQDME